MVYHGILALGYTPDYTYVLSIFYFHWMATCNGVFLLVRVHPPPITNIHIYPWRGETCVRNH